jgi:hypothetical protein
VKKKGKDDQINLAYFKLGDKYMDVISSSIPSLNATSFKLTGNRITPSGAHKFLQSVKPTVKEINLSKNKIGYSGIY